MMGMNMLMESMGVDPTKLQENVNAAVEHVKAIDGRLSRLEQAAAILLANTGTPITQIVQACLRIEDAILSLRTDADNTKGFISEVEKEMPEAAAQMQRQIEQANYSDDSLPEKRQINGSGNAADTSADNSAGKPTTN